jgi:hypothetical protein
VQDQVAIWLFAAAVGIHMLEEVIWLPAWSRDAGRWHEPVRRGEFFLATLVFLTVFYLGVIDGLRGGPGIYLTAGFAVVMILNVVWPHLGATLVQGRYAPGLATAVLLTLPTAIYLLLSLLEKTDADGGSFAVGIAAALFGALVVWPRLFVAGRLLLDKYH